MELKEYFKIIGKHLWVFVTIILLTTVFAFGFTKAKPTTYTSSTTFTVNKASALKQSQANYYLYDNYYNVQSSGLYAQVVASWFSSPAVVTDIYQKAGIAVPNVSQNTLGKTFKATYDQPSVINVSISGSDQTELQKLMNAAYDVLQAKTDELGQNDVSFYELAKFEPVVTKDNPSLILNTVIGLIAGIILGALIALAVEYFKED
ncbi:TPA: hypothetical protein DD449_01030 [Candidatus Berkelbacteria bacterium]|uniref:Polysaccharide chain length determinant N-terminal domain-containing protein n=1 Tax=Berkelbacteria bacterium GW2011_GWE1_39_12 TaxID=1618337 RepID=A0A0G4B5F6_9BACT|nr:MAG: hypothetical protein UT28_C0001G0881 [Berkelbacteria bacterium GW2011_GWE1_39_12]HBO60255.1 hypothetical protein [Candidatus Berkelbacteria bacterium]